MFCIQIQPDRAPDLDLEKVKSLCAKISANKELVKQHEITAGDDDGPYINLLFETEHPAKFWKAFKKDLYENVDVGNDLSESTMATCTGEHGWDDYLLLYHFDSNFELDDF
jgi:hypothetical protein